MKFRRIRKAQLKSIEEMHALNIEDQEDLNKSLSFYRKTYQGDFNTQLKKLTLFINNKKDAEIEEKLNLIKSIEEAEDFSIHLTITIEWKKSYMWGMNPRAYTNFGFKGESIGGCGYCKTSTATAQALNSHLPLMKALYKKEELRLKEGDIESRRDFVGYGSGYGILPYFEGGVGASSHEDIIKNLGLNMRCVTSTDYVDVYEVIKN